MMHVHVEFRVTCTISVKVAKTAVAMVFQN